MVWDVSERKRERERKELRCVVVLFVVFSFVKKRGVRGIPRIGLVSYHLNLEMYYSVLKRI